MLQSLKVPVFMDQVGALRSEGAGIVPGLPGAEFLVRTQSLTFHGAKERADSLRETDH